MFSKLWHKMTGHRRANPEQSYRAASAATGIPKSTLHAHDQRLAEREIYDESSFWSSEAGQSFLKRMVVGVIYTFGIKGGMGAGRIEEFMKIIPGVESWQEWLKERTTKFIQNLANKTIAQSDLQMYLLQTLLPWMYWQEILKRTPAKRLRKINSAQYPSLCLTAVQGFMDLIPHGDKHVIRAGTLLPAMLVIFPIFFSL